ncbi:MAG: hypothetical protein J6331_07435, partial [Lentisphaeria bacterium]|nr:hypothetical protein [Lentisphaeria bacterium]
AESPWQLPEKRRHFPGRKVLPAVLTIFVTKREYKGVFHVFFREFSCTFLPESGGAGSFPHACQKRLLSLSR